jgi:hypothetical protein
MQRGVSASKKMCIILKNIDKDFVSLKHFGKLFQLNSKTRLLLDLCMLMG